MALTIDNFSEWEKRLSEHGIEWLGLPVEAVGGGKLRSFLDPEGNMLQIIQR